MLTKGSLHRNHLEQGRLSSEEPSWFQSHTNPPDSSLSPSHHLSVGSSVPPAMAVFLPSKRGHKHGGPQRLPQLTVKGRVAQWGDGPGGAEGWGSCLPLGLAEREEVATQAGEERDLSPQTQVLMDTHPHTQHTCIHSFIHMHIHTSTLSCAYAHTCMLTCAHTCTYTRAHTSTLSRAYAHTCMLTGAHTHAHNTSTLSCAYAHTCMLTRAHTCTLTHTYTQAPSHMCIRSHMRTHMCTHTGTLSHMHTCAHAGSAVHVYTHMCTTHSLTCAHMCFSHAVPFLHTHTPL